MADEGREWTEAICDVLGGVCCSAAPWWVLLPWPSQIYPHFADEDTEAQRVEPIFCLVSKRQSRDRSVTAKFRACALPLCQAWVGTKLGPQTSRPQRGCPLTGAVTLLLGSVL